MRQVTYQIEKEEKEEIYWIFCSYDGQGILPPPSSLKLDYLFDLSQYFFCLVNLQKCQIFGWLADWLIGWLSNRLIEKFTDWLIDWLYNMMTVPNNKTDWQIDWFSNRLKDWLNTWLMWCTWSSTFSINPCLNGWMLAYHL